MAASFRFRRAVVVSLSCLIVRDVGSCVLFSFLSFCWLPVSLTIAAWCGPFALCFTSEMVAAGGARGLGVCYKETRR